jgi:hypothetical protein
MLTEVVVLSSEVVMLARLQVLQHRFFVLSVYGTSSSNYVVNGCMGSGHDPGVWLWLLGLSLMRAVPASGFGPVSAFGKFSATFIQKVLK